MSGVDICQHCNGTGIRDILSRARCFECDGTGLYELDDEEEELDELDELDGELDRSDE